MLSDDELVFYDALKTNDSAVKILGDKTLRGIARELVETVRGNVTFATRLRASIPTFPPRRLRAPSASSQDHPRGGADRGAQHIEQNYSLC